MRASWKAAYSASLPKYSYITSVKYGDSTNDSLIYILKVSHMVGYLSSYSSSRS